MKAPAQISPSMMKFVTVALTATTVTKFKSPRTQSSRSHFWTTPRSIANFSTSRSALVHCRHSSPSSMKCSDCKTLWDFGLSTRPQRRSRSKIPQFRRPIQKVIVKIRQMNRRARSFKFRLGLSFMISHQQSESSRSQIRPHRWGSLIWSWIPLLCLKSQVGKKMKKIYVKMKGASVTARSVWKTRCYRAQKRSANDKATVLLNCLLRKMSRTSRILLTAKWWAKKWVLWEGS